MKTNLCNNNLVNREILIISIFQKQLLILKYEYNYKLLINNFNIILPYNALQG